MCFLQNIRKSKEIMEIKDFLERKKKRVCRKSIATCNESFNFKLWMWF